MSTKPHKISDTGLYQEEIFKILTEYELARAQRYPNPVTLLHISLNLDKAKPELADNLGQQFAAILNTSLRVSDIPAHHGGDFLVLMPVTDEIGGEAVAQRLIARLKGTRHFIDGNTFKFAINIGIATHPGGEGISAEGLMAKAEKALNKAREKGTQTFVVFSNIKSN